MSGSIFPRLYEAQYASFVEDLPLWLSLAANQKGPILELGCGPGRVVSALHQAGFDVDGLDQDPEMLRRAEARLPAALRKQVRLLQGDLRRLSLDRLYALILVPCNTFAHLDEASAEEALAGIRRHLLAGGLFAAEMPTPGELLGKPTDTSEPVDMFIEPETGNPVQVYAEQEVGPSLGMIRVKWHYDELHPDGTVRRTDVPLLYTLWTPERLGEALKRAGFSSFEIFGDYDCSPFALESPRLLVVAAA